MPSFAANEETALKENKIEVVEDNSEKIKEGENSEATDVNAPSEENASEEGRGEEEEVIDPQPQTNKEKSSKPMLVGNNEKSNQNRNLKSVSVPDGWVKQCYYYIDTTGRVPTMNISLSNDYSITRFRGIRFNVTRGDDGSYIYTYDENIRDSTS
jgi:hypothetical protein